MDCLKDLKNQQDKHSSEINNLSGLREMIENLKEEMRLKDETRIKEEKENNNNNNTQNNTNSNNEKIEQNKSTNDHTNFVDQSGLDNLQSEIEQLKTRMTKN